MQELRQHARDLLTESRITEKVTGVAALYHAWQAQSLALDHHTLLAETMPMPGRPNKPLLVSPLKVRRRAMHTQEGRAALIHALAHIEFNAINLALDALWRYADMPTQYYADWLKVAHEEAYHFDLLNKHLQNLGFHYGDFDAHNSLWEMAEKTKNSLIARMALVPRTMEARGLDASPPLRAKLAQAGDMEAASILDIILHDEIGHVKIGNHWFYWLCQQTGREPLQTFEQLSLEYIAPKLRGPFNIDARRQAGFSELELQKLY